MESVLSGEARWSVIHGDSLEVLKQLPDDSVDSIVTDPPGGISFMGREWDGNKGGRDAWIAWLASIFAEAYRALKPGGHILVWAIPRTAHWTGMAVENAGFFIRDKQYHLFGSGFPHGHDVSKNIDERAGAKREVVGTYRVGGNALTPLSEKGGTYGVGVANSASGDLTITAPATEDAKKWDGWNTVLKPAVEEWILAQKPRVETTTTAKGKTRQKKLSVVECVLKYGTGAINVGACRIKTGSAVTINRLEKWSGFGQVEKPDYTSTVSTSGRWPANLVLSESGAALLDAQTGERPSTLTGRADPDKPHPQPATARSRRNVASGGMVGGMGQVYADEGGASRFFNVFPVDDSSHLECGFLYAAKAPTKEKEAGLEQLPPVKVNDGRETPVDNPYQRGESHRKNTHPTVKNLALMKHLVTLVTPPNGVILDPFTGSGSTGCAAVLCGFRFIGIELTERHAEEARARIAHWEKQP